MWRCALCMLSLPCDAQDMTPVAADEEGGAVDPGLLGAFAKSFFMVRLSRPLSLAISNAFAHTFHSITALCLSM